MRRLVLIALGLTLLLAGCSTDTSPSSAPTPSPSGSPSPSSSAQTSSPCLSGGTAEVPDSAPDTTVYLGLTEQEAKALAQDNGFITRVAARDDECLVLTMDYRSNRVNLYLVDGQVAAATIG